MSITLPEIGTYGNYSGGNYGAHCLRVDVGPITLWFSYKTVVAFHVTGRPRIVHQNDWGTTTGKHLNAIDGGDAKTAQGRIARGQRVSDTDFEKAWAEQVEPLLEQALSNKSPADTDKYSQALGLLQSLIEANREKDQSARNIRLDTVQQQAEILLQKTPQPRQESDEGYNAADDNIGFPTPLSKG